MSEVNDHQALESSLEELNQLHLLATVQPPTGASMEDELLQLDNLLAGFRNVNNFCCKKNTRLRQTWQHAMEKKEAALEALQKEKENLSTIIISSKANYLEELIDAERTIKKLENQLAELEAFIKRDVLVANETVSAMIRYRYGDESKKASVLNTAKSIVCASELAKAVEHISMPPPLIVAQIEPTPTILSTGAVQRETLDQDVQQPTAQVELARSGDVIEINDDDDGDEQNEEHMETDDSNLLKRFICDECSRSFSTMASKFRHETRFHGSTHEIEQQLEKVDTVKKPAKPLKRLRQIRNEKKIRELKRVLQDHGLLEFLNNPDANSTPVKKPRTVKRSKKTSGQNSNQ